MEVGRTYKVVYEDDQQGRVKILKYKGKDGLLLEFANPAKNGNSEFINEMKFVRAEEMDNGEEV